MAVRSTTLSLENLESRLNLSTLAGAGLFETASNSLLSQERATLIAKNKVISLTNAAAKKATLSPLAALPGSTTPAPTVSVSATTKAITVVWVNNSSNDTGFYIQRSTDGINFKQLATVAATKTSYTDNTALLGVSYVYRVTAFNKASTTASGSSQNISLALPPAPAAPSNLIDARSTQNSIALSWKDNATNETGYHLYRSTDGQNYTLLASLKPNAKSYTDTKLQPGTTYYYELSAWNPGGETYAPTPFTAATLQAPPVAPTNLAFSSVTGNGVTLNWTEASTDISGYRIYRSTNGKTFTLIGNTDANTPTFTDSTLNALTKYSYEVSAWNTAANTLSKPATVSTLIAAPNSPTNLAFTDVTTDSLTLSWTANSTTQTSFNIYRSTDGTLGDLIATVTGSTFQYADTGLTAGATYDYTVAAVNAGGQGLSLTTAVTTTANPAPTQSTTPPVVVAPTTPVVTTPATPVVTTPTAPVIVAPAAPTAVTSSAVTTSSLTLNWADDGTDTGIHIYRSTDGTNYSIVADLSADATTWSDTNLTAGTTYFYEIGSWNTAGETTAAISVSTLPATVTSDPTPTPPVIVLQAPNAPSAPTYTSVTSSAVTLNWTPPGSQTGYHIYRSTDGTNYTLVGTLAAGATTWSDTSVAPGTTYSYDIGAFNSTGETTSAATSVTTLVAAPNAPASITFTNITTTAITLNWSASTGETGYHIYSTTNGVNYTLVATASSSDTTWTATGLNVGTTYGFEVGAFNAGGETVSSPAGTSTLVAAPNAPGSLTFTNITTTAATLNWSAPGGQTGYHVYRSTNGGSYTLVSSLAANATTWTDTTLSSGVTYSYTLGAFNGTGENATASASLTTLVAAPNAPTSVSFTNLTTTGLTLNWSATLNTTGYHIYRSTDGTNYTLVGTLNASTTNWSDSGLTSGSTYYYTIGAYNSGGETRTAAASASTLIPAPSAPTNLSFPTITSTGLTFSWNATANATGYHIYRSTDNTHFTLVATTGSSTTSYTDSGLTAQTTYYYKVGAFNTTGEAQSFAASVTTAATTPPVTFSTQNETSFTELDITGTSGNDSIVVSQSGSTLTIVANGITTTEPTSFGDIKIFGVNGNDTITVQSSVNIATLIYGGDGNDTINNLTTGKATIVTIGNGTNTVTGNGVNTSYWVNPGDTVHASSAEIALGGVNRVASFYENVSRNLSVTSLPEPTDSGTETVLTNSSFWGTGPSINDINQTSIADCYFEAPLASLAYSEPQKLMNMGVDLGDGTYAVRFYSGGNPVYVRVDGELPTGYWNYGLNNQTPGADGNEWGSIFEKAYAFFRTGANTYASLNYGYQGQTFTDLGLSSSYNFPSLTSASSMLSLINTQLAAGHAIAASTNSSIASNVPIVESHVYSIIGAYMSNGTLMIQMRNPWGVDGFNDDSNPNDGLVTISYSTFTTNFNMLNYTTA
jgi:titin